MLNKSVEMSHILMTYSNYWVPRSALLENKSLKLDHHTKHFGDMTKSMKIVHFTSAAFFSNNQMTFNLSDAMSV